MEACLASLEALDYPDYEVVVVNDGSTDRTLEISERFPFCRIISQPNRGLSVARNVGANPLARAALADGAPISSAARVVSSPIDSSASRESVSTMALMVGLATARSFRTLATWTPCSRRFAWHGAWTRASTLSLAACSCAYPRRKPAALPNAWRSPCRPAS